MGGSFRRRISASWKGPIATRGRSPIRSWMRSASPTAASVADLGAGGGWFTVRLARRVGPKGVVYAEDIQQQMIEAIERRVRARRPAQRPARFSARPTIRELPRGRLDAVLIVDVYHEVEQPVELLRNVRDALDAARPARHRRFQA